MATASTSATPVNRMPRPRTSRSLSFGTIRITSAPRIGIIVVTVMAEFCHVIEPSLSSLSGCLDEHDGQRDHADEQSDRVPLHVAVLDVLQQPAGIARRLADRVHEPVDHVAVDP